MLVKALTIITTIAFIGLIGHVGVLHLTGEVEGISEPCPHPVFVERHICSYCKTLQDSADFSRYRPHPTFKNTVLFGHPPFEVKTYMKGRCGNVNAIPVAVCTTTVESTFNKPNYRCSWMGSRCFAEHSTSTGHLFYTEVKCF